jgi:hypothetical protein
MIIVSFHVGYVVCFLYELSTEFLYQPTPFALGRGYGAFFGSGDEWDLVKVKLTKVDKGLVF